jgi:hypothetical protein
VSLCLSNYALRHEGVWARGQLHALAALPPGTHWLGGWVDPRAGPDDVEKRKFLILQALELRPLSHPARSQSLYRLRYPAPR